MFLKFENSARPLEAVEEILVWKEKVAEFQKTSAGEVRRTVEKLRLRIAFRDGSAWSVDLKPQPKDREKFLEMFLKEINKRVITNVPQVVKRLIEKEGKQ